MDITFDGFNFSDGSSLEIILDKNIKINVYNSENDRIKIINNYLDAIYSDHSIYLILKTVNNELTQCKLIKGPVKVKYLLKRIKKFFTKELNDNEKEIIKQNKLSRFIKNSRNDKVNCDIWEHLEDVYAIISKKTNKYKYVYDVQKNRIFFQGFKLSNYVCTVK
jgi:hypothetical protein